MSAWAAAGAQHACAPDTHALGWTKCADISACRSQRRRSQGKCVDAASASAAADTPYSQCARSVGARCCSVHCNGDMSKCSAAVTGGAGNEGGEGDEGDEGAPLTYCNGVVAPQLVIPPARDYQCHIATVRGVQLLRHTVLDDCSMQPGDIKSEQVNMPHMAKAQHIVAGNEGNEGNEGDEGAPLSQHITHRCHAMHQSLFMSFIVARAVLTSQRPSM